MTDDLPLDDAERTQLYRSLLQGIANEAQDRLCADDSNHAWGPWHRNRVDPVVLAPRPCLDPEPADVRITTYSLRVCQNCGKREQARPT